MDLNFSVGRWHQQSVGGNAQGVGQFADVVERDIAFASFDMCHKCPVQLALEGEILLRPIPLCAQSTEILAEGLAKICSKWRSTGVNHRSMVVVGCFYVSRVYVTIGDVFESPIIQSGSKP